MSQTKDGTKILSLVKGNHTFIFKYELGEEAQVLEALTTAVRSRDTTFDSIDAAILSHQLGQHLAKELKAYTPKEAQ